MKVSSRVIKKSAQLKLNTQSLQLGVNNRPVLALHPLAFQLQVPDFDPNSEEPGAHSTRVGGLASYRVKLDIRCVFESVGRPYYFLAGH